MPRIHSLEKFTIGGIEQWVLVQGHAASDRVLLFLAGGPGMPAFPFAHALSRQTTVEQHATVAYWEQRGTGKSYHANISGDSMTIHQYVEDTIELAHRLCQRFRLPRLYLLGHSWGTILGTLAAQRAPELFHAYIGMGQVAHFLEGEQRSYDFV